MEGETYRAGAFTISAHSSALLNSLQLQSLAQALPGTKLPEMVYGSSQVRITNFDSCFCIDFNTLDALRYCSYEYRQNRLYQAGQLRSEHIVHLPSPVRVATAEKWTHRTLPKDSLFREEGKEEMAASEVVPRYQSDWTYSTPYRGLVRGLPGPTDFNPLPFHVKLTASEDGIPQDLLGPENPVLWGATVSFFEDQLDDRGHCKCSLRLRTMADCWYLLLRSYLHVDNVLTRSLDTRYYHEHGKSAVLREFRVQESSWEELRTAGLAGRDYGQEDLVVRYLTTRAIYKDKISFS